MTSHALPSGATYTILETRGGYARCALDAAPELTVYVPVRDGELDGTPNFGSHPAALSTDALVNTVITYERLDRLSKHQYVQISDAQTRQYHACKRELERREKSQS